MNIAARATCAPGCGSCQGSEWRPKPIPARISSCHGGVELDLVDPVAEAVVGAEPRRVLVRLAAPALGDGAPRERADFLGVVLCPAGALAPQRLDQHAIRLEDVVVLERRGLVQDLVRGVGGAFLDGGHRRGILAEIARRVRRPRATHGRADSLAAPWRRSK